MALVGSDVIIKALVDETPEGISRLRELIGNLNLMTGEKLVITDYVYHDIIAAARLAAKDERQLMMKIIQPYNAYFWMEPVSDRIVNNALVAMRKYKGLNLSLTDWTSLIWMAENGVDKIASDNDNLDKVVDDTSSDESIPEITDRLKHIKRI